MPWRFEHSAQSAATAGQVWRRYVDVEGWREWSQHGVEWSRIDGPFAAGTKGKMKAPRSFPVNFRLVDVEPERCFASEIKMPGARLRFEHRIEPSEPGVRITHSVELRGPLSVLYGPVTRNSVRRGLPDGVERLASMAAVS
jgi:hypothetical protein